jgi:hypothetical protein
MKNVITILMCSLCIFTGIAQSDLSGNTTIVPERTPELLALYQQAKVLENTGTAAEINANRIAIKNAWTAIDPEFGALYKPINAPKYDRLGQGAEPYIPHNIVERPDPLPLTRDWGTDILIRDDFVDGVDMTTTLDSGDIFVGMYENEIDAGGTQDNIYIYRSTTDGGTWNLFAEVQTPTPVRKMQLLSLDGDGEQYILAYIMFEGGLFQVARWNTATAAFDFDTVQTEVQDFSVDRNFPTTTSTMRVLATYLKDTGCSEVFSARSTVGEYGFNWVDEISVDGVCGLQIDYAYARAGDSFVTYTGASSGNLYVNSNDNFNDPASWVARETVELGTNRETLNPTIRASRLDMPTEKVVIWTSDRAAGTTLNYDGKGYLRASGAPFTVFSTFSSGGPDWNIAHTDGWIKRVAGVETIRFSYVRDNIDNSSNDLNRSITFNGTNFDLFEEVADSPIDVFDGFPSVTAETVDGMACLAFAGTNVNHGYRLYFDSKSTLSVDDNSFEGFKFYPNPAQDVLNLSANNTIESVSIFSLLGQKVIENSINQNDASVNVANLSPGIYIMKLAMNGQSATYKFIKQ